MGLEDKQELRACAAAIEDCVKEAVARKNETNIMKILTGCAAGSMTDPD